MGRNGQPRNRHRVCGRSIPYMALVTVVLGLAGLLLFGFYLRSEPAAENAVPVRISMAGFAPDEIRGKAGEPITIELINLDHSGHADGGGWHNFVIDSLGIHERVPPKGRQVFTITIAEPGEYDFYCDICCGGKENPYMHGRLIVS